MSSEKKLRVAPPRGRNLQLSSDDDATFQASGATDNATPDLKALASKRLEHIRGNPQRNGHATDTEKPMQLSPFKTPPKVAPPDSRATAQTATPQQVETILAGLAAAGRDLGTVEPLARMAMLALSRAAAAELAVAFCDAFEVATDNRAARAQCRRLLKNPDALAAAKAVWPDLPPPPPDAPAPTRPAGRPTVNHAPRWLSLIRERCPLLPEDEAHIRRHLGRLAPGDALALAERYAATWEQAAQAEPRPAARDNAGRRAANRVLRQGTAPAP